jgi:hypothetical protein
VIENLYYITREACVALSLIRLGGFIVGVRVRVVKGVDVWFYVSIIMSIIILHKLGLSFVSCSCFLMWGFRR